MNTPTQGGWLHGEIGHVYLRGLRQFVARCAHIHILDETATASSSAQYSRCDTCIVDYPYSNRPADMTMNIHEIRVG